MIAYYGTSPTIDSQQERLFSLMTNPPPRVGVDTETVSIADRTILGVGIAFTKDDAYYCAPDQPEFNLLLGVLRDPRIMKVYHNAPFDIRALRPYNVDIHNVDDTALMARLDMQPSAVLEDISFWAKKYEYGDAQAQSMTTVLKDNGVKKVIDLPYHVLAEKCCKDAQATLLLYDYFASKISMNYYENLRRIIPKLEIITKPGIALDHDRIMELHKIYTVDESKLRAICTGLGFRPSSTFEVGYILSKRGNILPRTKNRNKVTLDTSEKVLARLNDPLAHVILKWRGTAKILGTYLKPWLNADRAYTNLRMETITGRLNSGKAGSLDPDRNLQNIPKLADMGRDITVRSAFVPDFGWFRKADKSQLELRILAAMSGDEHMLDVFAHDGDLHADTVARIHVPRTIAKNFNYGISYGADEYTVADTLNTNNIAMIREMIDAWYKAYPGAAKFFFQSEEDGLRNGYVETLGGRKMRIPMDMGEKHARNCCRNYRIQGTAAEDLFAVMNHPSVEKHLNVTRLQIHDELIFDGLVDLPDMTVNFEKSAKEGHPVYEIKGELAHLMPGLYAPLEVNDSRRWG